VIARSFLTPAVTALICAGTLCVATTMSWPAQAQERLENPRLQLLAATTQPAAPQREAPDVEARLHKIERLSKRDPQHAQREISALGDKQLTPRGQLRLAAARARTAVFQFDMAAALEQVDGSLARARALGDPLIMGSLLGSRARAQLETNQSTEAAASALEALDLADRSGDTELRIDVRVILVDLAGRRGDFERAFALLEEADKLARDSHDVSQLAVVAFTDGVLSSMIDDPAAVQRSYATAEEAFRIDGDALGEADAARKLAQQMILTGRHADAIEPLNRALARFAALDDAYGAAVSKELLAYALAEVGQIERAFALHAEALQALDKDRHGDSLIRMLIGRLQLIVAHRRAVGAAPLIDDISQLLSRSEDLRMKMQFHREASEAYAALGRFREAHASLQAHLKLKARHDEQRLAWQLSAQRGRLESQRMLAELEHAQRVAQEQREALSRAERAVRWQTSLILLAALAIAVALYALVRMAQRSRRNSALAQTDYLTGVQNRRRISELGQRLLTRCRRNGEPFSLLILDLDHFKSINDEFGHEAGDRALRSVASELKQHLRRGDELGRYGGEEFAVVLPATATKRAIAIADRLRLAVAALTASDLGLDRTLTVSVGVATATDEHDFTALVARADRAMYLAKHEGRDRVLLAPSAVVPLTTASPPAPQQLAQAE